MCRNIKILFNFDPPATDDEIHAAAIQFIRKVSGTSKPSRVNEAAFAQATAAVALTVRELLDKLVTSAAAKDREEERLKARARAEQRFGTAAKVVAS